jgi:cytochrome c oxidase subunit 4
MSEVGMGRPPRSKHAAAPPGDGPAGGSTRIADAEASAQPSTATYLIVAAFLAALTVMEVSAFYIRAVKPVLLPLLLALSAGKFALIVLFYMHLRFDRWPYSAIFLFQLFFAAAVIVSLSLLFATFYGST